MLHVKQISSECKRQKVRDENSEQHIQRSKTPCKKEQINSTELNRCNLPFGARSETVLNQYWRRLNKFYVEYRNLASMT